MKTFKNFLTTIMYVATLVQASGLVALPHTIVLRNATDTVQRVWLRSSYTVKQGLLERCEADLIIREVLPRDSLVYGDRHHAFDFVEIKLNPAVSVSNLAAPTGGTTLSGLDGVKSVITIISKDGYELDNKGTTDQKKQLKETADRIQKATEETAMQARAKANTVKQTVETKAERAADTARKTAAKVGDKAARIRDDAAQKAKTVGDTVREKTHQAADTVRAKAHDAKEAVASGVTHAQQIAHEKAQAAKEAIANSKARMQNRTEEARMAASGRWAKMKASMYNWWCSVKIKLSRIFRR